MTEDDWRCVRLTVGLVQTAKAVTKAAGLNGIDFGRSRAGSLTRLPPSLEEGDLTMRR